MSQNIKMMH
jgi:hypothetical protein